MNFFIIEDDLCHDCRFFREGEDGERQCTRGDCDNRDHESDLMEPLTLVHFYRTKDGKVGVKTGKEVRE